MALPVKGTDYLKELGTLALASRLKRLSDNLMNDVARLYKEHHVNFEPRWFALMYLLDSRKQVSIAEAARLLQFTHPAIIQLAAQLEEQQLITTSKSKTDARKRLMVLTASGKKLFNSIQPLLDSIKSANDQLLTEADEAFLSRLSKLETAYQNRNIYERVKILNRSTLPEIKIITWNKKLDAAFYRLNMEWIVKLFKPEPADLQLLENPGEEIINKGGEIFFAQCNSKIAGTVAMIPHGKGCYELAKMGITEKMRGYGIAHYLMKAAIKFAENKKAQAIILDTNSSLKPAITLYKKYGFKPYRKKEKEIYERSDVHLKLKLS